METLFLIKEAGWICLLIGYWIIVFKNNKENIPLILFMAGVMLILAALWTENGIIYNLLDQFAC